MRPHGQAFCATTLSEVIDTSILVNDLMSAFSGNEVFSRDTLKAFYKSRTLDFKDSSFSWLVYHLCADKIIQRVGRSMFQLYDTQMARIPFNPSPTKAMSEMMGSITAKFPLLNFSIWETWMLNEFLNHQLERNLVLIDVEKQFEESVFEALKADSNYPVLYKPTQREFDLYADTLTAAVFPLTSEAPKSKQNIVAPIEKILVDLFANKSFRSILSFGEYPAIFEDAFAKYLVDEKTLFRYARRRKADQTILEFIHRSTSIRLLTEG